MTHCSTIISTLSFINLLKIDGVSLKFILTEYFGFKCLHLLCMIHPITPEQLLKQITQYEIVGDGDQTVQEEQMDSRPYQSYEEMDVERRELADDLLEQHEDFTELLAVQAVNELGVTDIGEY